MNNARKTLGNMLNILIILTTITLLSVTIIDIYSKIALYVNFGFAALGMILYGRINRKDYIYIALLTAYCFVSVFITNGGVGSAITVIVPFMMLTVFSKMQYTLKAKKVLVWGGIIAIIGLYLYSIPYGENYHQYLITKINPNTLSMFIMFFFMIVCVCSEFNNVRSKVGLLGLLAISFLGMYNYESRGTTLALICFVFMNMFPTKIYSQKRFVFGVILLIAIGTAFPFIYLNLYESGYSLEMFGKSLYTGREYIWSNMFSLMKGDVLKIFFGAGSHAILWEHSLNVHNNYFNIIVNFGVVGFFLYYAYIVNNIWNVSKHISTPRIRKSLIMFACSVLVLGFFETTSLWSVVYPFAYFGLIMANSECLKENEPDFGKES